MNEIKSNENTPLNNWCKDDIVTIISWVAIGRRKIREMELIVEHNRLFMRTVTFYNLIFSTASGTVGVATIENAALAKETRFWCNVAVVLASYMITMLTGALKICQVQENLELAIKYKQDWIGFAAEIASEIQLPDAYRRESQFIINKNRAKYLELLKLDIEVPKSVERTMQLIITKEQESVKKYGHRGKEDSSSLVDILANIIDFEHMKLMDCSNDDGDDETSSNNIEYENEAELRYKIMRSQVTTPSSRREAAILQEENDRLRFKEIQQEHDRLRELQIKEIQEEENDRLRELQIKEIQEEVIKKVQYEGDENNRKIREDLIEKIRDDIDDDIENPRIIHK